MWANFGPLMNGGGLCKVLQFKSFQTLNVTHGYGRMPFPLVDCPGGAYRLFIYRLTDQVHKSN